MNDLESDDESVDTPLISPFPHSDNDSDDGEVLNELSEKFTAYLDPFLPMNIISRKAYNTIMVEGLEGTGRNLVAIVKDVYVFVRSFNGFDGDDLAFQCMIGFRKFIAYLDPFLPMNTISRKAYNTIMVEGLEGMGRNLVAIVKDVYVFVRSFTYIADFVVLEDIKEFIMSDMAEVLMGKPFRKITKLEYDVTKGLVSFTKIFDTYIFRMPRTIPRLRNLKWSKIPPLLELSQHDLMNELRHPYEKNKLMYKKMLKPRFRIPSG
nr:homeodomain-like protein [Tanacetum cinerariifolium]